MARKKDSRSRDRSKLLKRRRRKLKVKAKKAAAFGAFHGNAESLEKRELLAGDTLEAMDGSPAEHSLAIDTSPIEILDPQRGGEVLAAPPIVASVDTIESLSLRQMVPYRRRAVPSVYVFAFMTADDDVAIIRDMVERVQPHLVRGHHVGVALHEDQVPRLAHRRERAIRDRLEAYGGE